MTQQPQRTPDEMLNTAKLLYYVIYAMTIVLFGAIWYLNYSSISESGEPFKIMEPNTGVGLYLQYGIILYTLAVIPGALYWFKRKCVSITKLEDESVRYNTYYMCAHLRMGAIALALVLSLVGYMVLGAYRPMLWLAAIAVLALVFTKPSAAKTEAELHPEEKELNY